MAGPQKVIITCALTGSGHTPSMSPYLPYTVAGDTSEEAQAKFDELMTPELHEKFGHAILAIGAEATPPRHARAVHEIFS